jgi:class 3 adenylate cyclase
LVFSAPCDLDIASRATSISCLQTPRSYPAANDLFSDIVPDGASAYALTGQINLTHPEGVFLAGEPVKRRLAVVLATDVAGYSRLMGCDEERTLANLKSFRKTL